LKHDLIISSQLGNISKVRFFLDKVFIESGLDRSNFNRVLLGLCEAVNNSIVHGNKLDENKNVFITVLLKKNQLYVEVKDEGNGFPFECINDPTCFENLKKENGRGIFLIRNMADDMKYSEGGSFVMIKYNLG
jgi:serine/threonine-protein kinase RsbW